MTTAKRQKTSYPGVFYIEGEASGRAGSEKTYYIRYRRNGKQVEEKAGRQYVDNMTPAQASRIRGERSEGKALSNEQRREAARKDGNRPTISHLWDLYCASRPSGCANRTDACNWKKHIPKRFGDKEPCELVKFQTDRLRVTLLKTLSPQTTKHILSLLNRVIRYGLDQGITPPLPFSIEYPRFDNTRTEILTPEELIRLWEVLETTHLTTCARMMKLALFTGMRRGEIFKLRWQDIDTMRGFIHLQETKSGKNHKIPLNNKAKELLQGIDSAEGSDYIFPSRNGGARKDIQKDANAIKKAAELPAGFRPFHGLRHVFATMLANSGEVTQYELQKLLTHGSPQMTQRYAHLMDGTLQKASAVNNRLIDKILNPGEKVLQFSPVEK